MCGRRDSAHLQVGVEDPDEGADGRVAEGLQDDESTGTVFTSAEPRMDTSEEEDVKDE